MPNLSALTELQLQHREWLAHNFPDAKPHEPLLGLVEEVGELAHAHLKMEQGIRGSDDEHRAEAKDSIGDILVFLSSYCNLNGYSLEECITDTWAEVKKRDWIKHPKHGVPTKEETNA